MTEIKDIPVQNIYTNTILAEDTVTTAETFIRTLNKFMCKRESFRMVMEYNAEARNVAISWYVDEEARDNAQGRELELQ